MAHSLSAKKRIRQSAKRNARNRWRKDQVKDVVKDFEKTIVKGDAKAAAEGLKKIASALGRVASKGTIHKNAAARTRSRLAKKVNALKAKAGTKA